MKTYPAGDLTKEKIYDASKAVFYRDGYKKAKMKDVSAMAGIKQSVFYYHYKNKGELAKMLYGDFGTAHSSAILSELIQHGFSDNGILAHCTCMALLMINSVETPNIGRFWAEMYTDNLTVDIPFHRHFFDLMYKKCFKEYTKNDFELFLVGRSSINCGYMLAYLDKKLDMTPEELAAYKIMDTLTALDYPREEARALTEQVLTVAQQIPIRCGDNFHIYLDDHVVF